VKSIRGLGCICGIVGRRREGKVWVESVVHSEQAQREDLWAFYQHTTVETAHHIHYNPSRYKMKNKEFDSFLDSEIENLRSEIQRPGWTSWALTAALAGLVWILISLVEQGNYSLKAVASLLLVVSFLTYSYALVKDRVSPSLPSERPKGRLMPTNLVNANMPVIILIVAQLAFFTIVIPRFSTELGSVATSISLAAISLLWLTVVAGIFIVAMRIPVPFNSRHRLLPIVSVIYLVVMLLSIWYQIRFLWISAGVASVYDVRFALVVAAIFYLSCRLVSVPRGALTLNVLRTIRRELVLGRIELGPAKEQVDIALTGMRASDLLEGYVSKLLSLYRDASAELSKAVSCIDQMDKSVSETAEKLPRELVPLKRQDMEMLTSSMEKARTIIVTDIPHAYRPLGRRMGVLRSMGFVKECDDLQDLDEKLKAVEAELDEQIKEFTKKFDELRKSMQADKAQMA
jgi:hypothetical protein